MPTVQSRSACPTTGRWSLVAVQQTLRREIKGRVAYGKPTGEYNGRPGYKRQNKVFCVNGFKESFDTEEAERHGITRNVARHLPETTAGFAVAEDPASAPEEESASEEGLGRPGARGRRIN